MAEWITSQDASLGRHSFQSTNFDMSRKQNSIDSMGFRKTVFSILSLSSSLYIVHNILFNSCDAVQCSITRSIFVWHFMWIKHAFSIIFAPPHTTCFESFGCYFALSRDSCYSRTAFRFIWYMHIYIWGIILYDSPIAADWNVHFARFERVILSVSQKHFEAQPKPRYMYKCGEITICSGSNQINF